jgi:catechol 2,3-dioxygenase-like lactoylglutathione lyase family enzyme
MLSHVFVGVTNFPRAFAFYEAVLADLGLVLKFRDDSTGNGQMVALLAPDRMAVDRAFATALRHGGISEGGPGLRPHYHPAYYGAYFRDPDGNKICICCHDEE